MAAVGGGQFVRVRLAGITVLLAACWWQLARLGDLRHHLPAFYGWFGVACGLYAAALWVIHGAERARGDTRGAGGALAVIVLGALGFRVLLLPSVPTLSDDLYRYLWDGRVQLAGFDPYAHAPTAPVLAALRDDAWAHINFPELRTVYPPVLQAAFRMGAWLTPTLVGQKTVLVAAEVVLIGCLAALLRLRGASVLWVAAYAWHPLAILEVAGSGHGDVVGIAWLWLGLVAWQLGRRGSVALSWAMAFLSKFTAVVLVPWWWCRRVGRWWLGAAVLVGAIPLVAHPAITEALADSLGAMTGRFESNASLYVLAAHVLQSAAAARLLLFGAGGVWVLWWAHREPEPLRFLLGAFAVGVAVSPVVHPWYLLWLLPLLCVWRIPALLTLSGTAVLAYTAWPGYLAGGPWGVPVWARLIEYGPVVVLVGGAWMARRRRRNLQCM